ncbi:tyrosine-type recombinase/integrase [Brevibacterium linens]|uniref:tyrosine-type recombinase/integrase n=1 Tax=Brevibacterium linens TaxID=1703 RepID=UPI003BF5AF3D
MVCDPAGGVAGVAASRFRDCERANVGARGSAGAGTGKGLYEDTPKSEAGRRSVPVPKALWSVVEDHLADHVGKAKKSLVFPRTSKGTVWTHPNVLRNAFNRARDEWNRLNPDDVLGNFTFHGLRHTALTRVGQAGATLEELKRYAGHSSAEVVSKYQHATKDRLAMLAQTLSDQM